MTGKQAIDDNVHTFGQIAFLATLSKDAPTTDVHLDTMQLYTGDNGTTPVGGCVTPVVQSGNFNLILRCGDATMSLVMAGKGDQVGFIKPATPNPVSGGTVTFQYANKMETNLTLSIYDALGKEVLRPIDNVRHDAGAWQISTDVTNLASGAYTYRLTNGHVVASGQFVIQR